MARARRTSSARRPLTRLLAGTAVAAAALGVTGCSAMNPITTQDPYAASDGFRVELGSQVTGSNLLVLAAGEGEPGLLIGSFTNRTTERTAVAVVLADSGEELAEISLDPRETVLLGASSEEATAGIEIDTVPVPPGALLSLSLATPQGGSTTLSVPVLDDTLEAYEDQVPS